MQTPTSGKETSHCKPEQAPIIKSVLELATFGTAVAGLLVFWGQWNAAKGANDINANNFRAGQRAWVGSTSFEFVPIEAEKPIIWRTVLKNFGNSPAMTVEIRDTAQLVVSAQVDPTMAWMLTATLPNATGRTLTMFNGQTYTDQGGRNFLVTQKQVQDINEGRSILVYIAEIKYRNIFESPHKTMLCQVLDNLGTHGCGFGEQAD